MNNPFIVIEGIDGTGKSSVVDVVSHKIGAKIIRTTISSNDEYLRRCELSGQARYLYYVSSLLLISAQIREERRVRPVISDRYIPTTIAYHEVMGVDTTIVDIGRITLEQPDITILLIATSEELVRRIRSRQGDRDAEAYRMHIESYYRPIEEKIREHANHVIDIDTTQLTISEISDQICRIASE